MTTTTTSTALAPVNPKQLAFRETLGRYKNAIAAVLPRHMTADRVLKVVLSATAKTPALLDCTQQSVMQSVMAAAQLGLEPGSPLGHAYLVPYGRECTLIVGYRGLIDLARRSGQIESIEARIVYARDKFSLAFGLEPRLEHEPCLDGDPGEMRLVYAVARLKGGETQVEVMTKSQVDAIKNRSRASGAGPWKTDYAEMARKTVVRRICKYLPVSIELRNEAIPLGEVDDVDADAILTTATETQAEDGQGKSTATETQQAQQPVGHDPETGELDAAGYIEAIRKATTKQEIVAAANIAAQRLTGEDRALASKAMQERLAQVGA